MQAALDDVTEDLKSASQVRVEVEKNEYVLCTLRPGKVDQSNLSVFFSEGERVTFRVTGNRFVTTPTARSRRPATRRPNRRINQTTQPRPLDRLPRAARGRAVRRRR